MFHHFEPHTGENGGVPVTQIMPSFEDLPGTNWKMVGEAEFPNGTTIGDLVHTWLVDTLRPLNLNARFLDKILASAHLATERNIQYADKQDSDPVHMLIFTPVDIPSHGQSWGFFRVEKEGDPPAENDNRHHAIAFYLYLEGK